MAIRVLIADDALFMREMIKEIMEYYMGHDRRPMQTALNKIKADVQKLF